MVSFTKLDEAELSFKTKSIKLIIIRTLNRTTENNPSNENRMQLTRQEGSSIIVN